MRLRRRILDFRAIIAAVVLLVAVAYGCVTLTSTRATSAEMKSLEIPGIGLTSDVMRLAMTEHGLDTPDTIVGSYQKYFNKTLLIGHSTTVFQNLSQVKIHDIIYYDNQEYSVIRIKMLPKDEIIMRQILKTEEDDTLVLMTCAGELLDGGDATHRIMVTARANNN